MTVPQGISSFTLQCTSDGSGISWFKDNAQLSNGDRVTIVTVAMPSGGLSTLRIDGLGENDSGVYACRNPDDPTEQDSVNIHVEVPEGGSKYALISSLS